MKMDSRQSRLTLKLFFLFTLHPDDVITRQHLRTCLHIVNVLRTNKCCLHL